MTADRTRCVYDFPNGVPYLDQTTFDRLHQQAASLAHTASKTEGIGGTERLDTEAAFDLVRHAQHVASLAADALDLAVDAARDHGLSWQQIGDAFGITKQAAQQRFGGAK